MQKRYALLQEELEMYAKLSEPRIESYARTYKALREEFKDAISDEEVVKRLEIAPNPSKIFASFEDFRLAARENPIPMFCAMIEVGEQEARVAVRNLRGGRAVGRSIYDLLFLLPYLPRVLDLLQKRLSGEPSSADDQNSLDELFKTYGARGGAARADKYEPLKQEAVRLAHLGRYKSANHAAKRISANILAMPEAGNVGLSKDRAEKTIAQWLRKAGVVFAADEKDGLSA
ncbi:hypothetical protein [Cupriavidus metallidurans]|uniref:hypothetical protein n=1 Tax=Cupriavidus metallidurans TaxID=119219 RepID=UPI003D073AED